MVAGNSTKIKKLRQNNPAKNKDWLSRNKIVATTIIIVLLITTIGYFLKSFGNSAPIKHDQIIKVGVTKSQLVDMPVRVSALGTVTATSTINIKSQVSGQLIKIYFKDGQKVDVGQLLAEIDPRPYQAQVDQNEGQLERDKALLKNAEIDLKRYENLWKQNSIAKQVLDTQRALVMQYQGTVKLDAGLLSNAKTNLSYCKILSPVDGYAGISLVDEGNIVLANSGSSDIIAVVNTLNPIDIIFSIPEHEFSSILKATTRDLESYEVEIYDQNHNNLLAIGKLTAIDNQIDATTGMIKLKSSVDNNNHSLFPNQFVNVQVISEVLKNVVIIPRAAVQTGPNGKFVYVANDFEQTNSIVKVAPIEVNELVKDDNYTVIKKGLDAGRSIIIEGVDKLIDGAKVTTFEVPQRENG